MDKENGKGNDSSSGPSKVSSVQDPAAILDAASLFGAYWPRSDASTANLFAAASGFGLPPHAAAALPFGLLPAAAAAQGGRGSGSSSTSGGGTNLPPSYPASSTAASSGAAAAAAAAYSNAAYSSTLSVAASQAASLGMPVASAAWWSMASHLAAQDYLARLQASGLNFPMGGPADPYAALGLPSLAGGGHHKSKSPSKSSRSSSNNKDKMAAAAAASMGSSGSMKMDHHKLNSSISMSKTSSNNSLKYSSPSGLTIQPSVKLPGTNSSVSDSKSRKHSSDLSYLTKLDVKQKTSSASVSTPPAPITSSSTISSVTTTTSCVKPPADSPSIYSNPMSLASNQDKGAMSILNSSSSHNSVVNSSSSGLPSSILSAALEGSSDPNSILGGVRLPPDTEIIKYTSSIVGPKIPGTTNRGRKKTISLDPPSVSVLPSHSSTGLSIERTLKRARLSDDDTPGGTSMSDRVEVIKLPATNGSPSGISSFNSSDGSGEAPLNLSLKPNYTTSGSTSSLNSLSNMSANIGSDRISRRKPGPKPRRVIPMDSTPPPPSSTPNTILNQYFSGIDSPRPPSRNEGSDGGSSTSSTSAAPSGPSGTGGISIMNHKEGRPRNLGRGVSKPKKNTVASLLAQSRALGIKPVPMLDPNASMNQQMNLLKSNILAAQQYISEAGGDEKALNKFLQERFKGTLSDSSTVDASDSDNLTDSNHTDSEIETEIVAKKQKQYDERLLRVPLERGWKRETVIRGVTKNGGIRGDVSYAAPDSSNKFKQMSDITQYLEYQKSTELTKDNFTFSCRVIIGDYLQPVPPEMQTDGNEYIYLTEEDVTKRLEELRAAMRTSLPVEQRIEMAKKQQAARAAARLDREQQRLTKELERNERQEAARREREARSQQLLEAKRKRQEELEKQKQEEQHRKQQERELKRQQAAMLKEQIYIQEINKQREMLYTVELEKERRRQHLALIKAMESRRKLEEKEKRKQQLLAEKQANKEKKLEQRRVDLEILTELRKPCEDLELNQKPLPTYERIHGLKLSGKAYADTLMIFEFLHNFGETLGFDMDSLPTLDSIQQALVPNDHSYEAEEELFSVITHLLVCAIEDPGIPNPARHTTILGQSLRQADITHVNLSEILRIYLYANATGEVKALTGVHFERDREKRIADHHQTEDEMQQTVAGKNSHYYELLHENPTYKMSDLLKDKPFMALSPTDKAAILAFICNELLQNKAVTRQIENSLENMIQHKKEKWLLDQKIRKLKVVHSKKLRTEALEKSHNKSEVEDGALDSPHLLHKDDLLEDEEHEMSDNESVGTQPEEEEDAKLSGEELAKKLEKLSQTSENHLQTINTSMSQLRAVTFGEDRYFRRYWSLPRSGGIFIEAMESAEPEEFEEQSKNDQVENLSNGIRNLNELHSVIEKVEKIDDHADDKEVSSIVGESDTDKESNIAIIKPQTNNNESEHRKTPNRLENGEITETHNLAELNKSVENIVQSLEERIEACKEEKLTESQLQSDINDAKNLDDSDSISNRKFNLFERLGQCMERENRTEEDLKAEVKAEVKEELKNEILKELKQEIKSEIKTEMEENDEFKWFSILHKDGSTCDEVHLTAGNKWDNGNVGACTKDITELKIPVFPPPCSNSGMNLHHNCESPAPLQMTSEESVQLELIRKHGMPSSFEKKPVPFDQRYGWWRIKTLEQLREVLENLHVRGVRERELKRSFVINMQQMYNKGKLVIEEGCDELTKLSGENIENINFVVGDIPMPDVPGSWSKVIAHRVDMFLLEQVEALEDKVASASMQVKGWKIPERDTDDIPYGEVVNVIKNKLSSLEINIERRYLKPPLGVNTNIRSSTGSSQDSSFQSTTVESAASTPVMSQQVPAADDIPKGLGVWREAVNRASTSAQLAMCLYSLESSIAWDKSIMKANCQFCHSGDNEDKLLLCDSCDRGYHTYCFKPKMENIPEGDWYCHECMNKATGDRNCIVCGRKISTTSTRLLVCELCPRAYHTDCIQPQIHKVPRGKWYCTNCFSKKPQKKPVKKNHTKPTKENESTTEQPPASPAPSHSSVTTNDDVPTTNCSQNSDVSNSSLTSGLINAGSPSTCAKKEKEKANKKLMKELTPCRLILEDLECHDDAWPFLLPVNTKQFPTYKKIIKIPMDLSTIKKRLQDLVYKSREEFCSDVRQIFNNCETFNEDDSPVGKAGHCMRQFFESRWNELCASHS